MKEEIQRIDLRLRSKYPHLRTQIFQINRYSYTIHIEDYDDDFNALNIEFQNKIRYITSPVTLTSNEPTNYECKISKINDNEIGDSYSGLPLTSSDLLYLLTIKNPTIDIQHIEGNNGDNKIKIYTNQLTDSERELLLKSTENIKSVIPYVIIDNQEIVSKIIEKKRSEDEQLSNIPQHNEFKKMFDNPVLSLIPTKISKKYLSVEAKDEEFWFENIHKIYNGTIQKKDIFPIFDNEYS